MHPWLFALFCLVGLLLIICFATGVFVLATLKKSDNPLLDGLLSAFVILAGGYLLAHWLIIFLLTAPFYIPLI